MILVDANIPLYAYNASAPEHETARRWLEEVWSSPEPAGLACTTLLAFLRIGTNQRAFPRPFLPAEAASIVTHWLKQPSVTLLNPGERH